MKKYTKGSVGEFYRFIDGPSYGLVFLPSEGYFGHGTPQDTVTCKDSFFIENKFFLVLSESPWRPRWRYNSLTNTITEFSDEILWPKQKSDSLYQGLVKIMIIDKESHKADVFWISQVFLKNNTILIDGSIDEWEPTNSSHFLDEVELELRSSQIG